jgi:hypothetical protein
MPKFDQVLVGGTYLCAVVTAAFLQPAILHVGRRIKPARLLAGLMDTASEKGCLGSSLRWLRSLGAGVSFVANSNFILPIADPGILVWVVLVTMWDTSKETDLLSCSPRFYVALL